MVLTSLTIRDVVLIEALNLEFERGLAVLTGETGAGKSILLDSLGLALGERGEAALVRRGAAQAAVSATFEVAADHPVQALISDNGLDGGETIILRRIVKADGGSRAFINDQPIGAALLREIGGQLVEIHGQHDDRGLLNPRGHRDLLDLFGRADTRRTADAWLQWRDAETALTEARTRLEADARDREWLAHAVAELREAKPLPGEETELADERATMLKGQRLAEDLQLIDHLVTGSEGGLAQLRQAARRLERLAPELGLLADALAAIDRALNEAGEAEDHLAAAREALAYDPARLDAAETRLFELRALARKHRVDVDSLAALATDMEARAEAIEAGENRLAALGKAVIAARSEYSQASAVLTSARRTAAVRLDTAVAGELVPLKLDAARFRTVIDPVPEALWSAAGQDRVEFEIATNPGAPFAPLLKIASGGELSRFILALKVALAESGSAGTMIFDEIDRGVGGAVASAIGERLVRLADGGQVLVVTHSPQVAARGAHQWRITKSSSGDVTRTDIQRLSDAERREEIARMLSGQAVSPEARAQATLLLGEPHIQGRQRGV